MWKPYQYKRAGSEEIFQWIIDYKNPNIGIITGKVSNLTVIDLDDISKRSALKKIIPEIEKTTRVKTKKGYHFYFYGNNVRSLKNLFKLGIELKAKGNYVVAPPSIINGHKYYFEIPLSHILPLPEIIKKEYKIIPRSEKEGKSLTDVVKYNIRKKGIKFPPYRGLGVSCIGQILSVDLQEGIRDYGLFVFYNLLIQNKNEKNYSKDYVILKNRSLSNPLTDKDLKKVFRKKYTHSCSTIRETLPFINCKDCRYLKGGLSKKMIGSLTVKNINKLPKLSNTERGILSLVDVFFSGEKVTVNRIVETSKTDRRTVEKAIEGLKDKGIDIELKK